MEPIKDQKTEAVDQNDKGDEYEFDTTEKTYVTSKKKWSEFDLHPEIIEVLKMNKMTKPTRVQEESLPTTANLDRKKFNLLIRSSNGSGKTLCYLLPILNALKQGVVTAKDKKVGPKLFKNEIFCPQAIILVQTGLLAQQIELILRDLKKHADDLATTEERKLELLNFTVGSMTGATHTPGDIIVSVTKSFLNRHQRGNISFENCNFVTLDEVDEIYDSGKEELQKILKTVIETQKTKLIVVSATMKKQFLQFYHNIVPTNGQTNLEININDILRKQLGHNISLEGVSNYICVTEKENPESRFNYVTNEIFKQLYSDNEKQKVKVIIFFNSIVQIQNFKAFFDQAASDLTSQSHQYLDGIKVGVVASSRKINGIEDKMTHEEKNTIITKFRNNDLHVLLATNVIARGIDIRDVCFVINMDVPREKGNKSKTGERSDGDISIDTYLHRVGRTGRHSDRGVALTVTGIEKDKKKLIDSVLSVHKVQINQIGSVAKLHDQILKCISFNTNTSNPSNVPA